MFHSNINKLLNLKNFLLQTVQKHFCNDEKKHVKKFGKLFYKPIK